MAYPVKLSELSLSVLQRANLEGGDRFIKPTELIGYINSSIAEFVDEVRGTTWTGNYARSVFSFPTVTGTQTYKLPTDFLSLLSVDVFVTSGSPVISAIAYQEEERNVYNNYPVAFGWGFAGPVFYQIQGDYISFIPVPQGAYTIKLNYTPTAPVLSDPDDSIDSVNGWEDFIVLGAAIKCLVKQGELDTVSLLESQKSQVRERIRAMAPRRDMQTAENVHAIINQGGGAWDW